MPRLNSNHPRLPRAFSSLAALVTSLQAVNSSTTNSSNMLTTSSLSLKSTSSNSSSMSRRKVSRCKAVKS